MSQTKMPTAPEIKPPSFRDDFKQIVQMAGVLATALSMLSLGLPAIIAWITEHLGPAIPIWKALVATTPLTLSVAAVGVGLIRGWIDNFWQLLFFSAGAIVVTSGVAHLSGMPGWIDLTTVWRDLPTDLFWFPLTVASLFLKNYWRIYGPQLFASSLLVGAFLAWAWGEKLLPHFDRLRRAATTEKTASNNATANKTATTAERRAA